MSKVTRTRCDGCKKPVSEMSSLPVAFSGFNYDICSVECGTAVLERGFRSRIPAKKKDRVAPEKDDAL